jgi:ABC-type nitrate/sulfonate/bicarbonate transport system permease component
MSEVISEKRRYGLLRQVASVVFWIAAWQGLSTFVFSSEMLPSPGAVLARGLELTSTGELPLHLMTSLTRIVVGFGIGTLFGIVAGLVVGRFKIVESLVNPSLGFIRSIPPIALVPFSIIVFGIGELSKYAVISYIAFIVVTLHTAAGVRETPRIRVRAAETLGATGLTMLRKIILPSAFPFIISGAEVALNLSFMAVVSAELIDSRSGLGYLITDAITTLETDKMLVGILCLGLLGALVSRGSHHAAVKMLRKFAARS